MKLAALLQLAAAVLVIAGCSSAWRRVDEAGPFRLDAAPLELPAHRAVERVTLRIRGHELEFVGYRTCDPATRHVRAQLLLESGISVIDVVVNGAANDRISGSAFEAIPRLAEVAMEDLRRVWGSRSVFTVSVPATGFHVSPRGAWSLMREPPIPAVPLADGSYLVVPERYETERYETDARLTFTLLGPDLEMEAQITYSDFDDDGVPREIHLVDLRNAHTLDVEVEEVVVVGVRTQL